MGDRNLVKCNTVDCHNYLHYDTRLKGVVTCHFCDNKSTETQQRCGSYMNTSESGTPIYCDNVVRKHASDTRCNLHRPPKCPICKDDDYPGHGHCEPCDAVLCDDCHMCADCNECNCYIYDQ